MVSLMSVLNQGRRFADARMTETVQIGLFRDGTDPETGDATQMLDTERYVGAARVKYPSATVSESDVVAQPVYVQDIILSIPSGSPPCFEGDEVIVVSSTADASLTGRRYRVRGAPQAGQTTAHRYPVAELS